jgi:hypothetical protein
LLAAVVVGFLVIRPAVCGIRHAQRILAKTTPVQRRLSWLGTAGITGVVLPLDPADAGWLEWANSKLRPVLDDRSELFASYYGKYRRIGFDLAQDRHNSYRLTDGSYGGWRQLSNTIAFDWIVSRAGDIETNLGLSSSVYWSPVYWDADIVLFGHKDHELAQVAANRLAGLKAALPLDPIVGRESSSHTAAVYGPVVDGELELWRDYSRREFVELAKVYVALECPQIVDLLIDRLSDLQLVAQRNSWPDRARGTGTEIGNDFRVQEFDR